MREIKFRAWDKKEKNTTYGGYIALNGERTYIGDKPLDSIRDNDENRFVLMQYTGLKDKNGKDIYEGDILQSEYNSHEKNSCHPVVWGDGKWAVDHSINDCCKPWRGDLAGHHRSETIIGNIYENPELLK